MDIHEARSLFISITSEFLDVAAIRHEPTNLTWWIKSERVSLLKEFLEDRKWSNGFYIYSSTVWELSREKTERRSGARYLTKNGQVIHQERYLPEGGNIDDVQISTSIVDSTCSHVEALIIICREMLIYAPDFGIDAGMINDFYRRLGEPAPRPKLFVVR